MTHEEIKTLIPAYLEGELDEKDRKLVEAHLAGCAECQQECEELGQLEEVLNKMAFKQPAKDIWDVYWASVYNRLERRIGWIFLSIGLIVLVFMGAYPTIADFIADPERPLVLKVGLLVFMAGGVIVFVSILREQLFFRKRERYKDIRR